jgi:hypothetical protein
MRDTKHHQLLDEIWEVRSLMTTTNRGHAISFANVPRGPTVYLSLLPSGIAEAVASLIEV